MSTRTYTLSPDQVSTIRNEMVKLGTPIPEGNNVTWNPPDHKEVDLGLAYDGTSKLTVTILDDAWYETSGEVFDALDKYMPAGSLPTA